MKTALLKFNNWQVKARKVKVRPEQILVLSPRCLQYHKCPQPVTTDPHSCKFCGKCQVMDMVKLCDELGVQLCFATGGGVAVKRSRDPKIKAIVAVACAKELCMGIVMTLPKPVFAVKNIFNNGPCVDTGVSIENVRSAIESFIAEPN
ncbi:DUF116 domain-containing protein [bacterium]|nr:DUF116 domain-containing protein [bacterium]